MAYSANVQLLIDLKDTRRACELGGVLDKWAPVYTVLLTDIKELFTMNDPSLVSDDLVWFKENYDFLTTTLPSFTYKIEGNTFSIVSTNYYAFSKGEAQLLYQQIIQAGYPAATVAVHTLATYMTSGNGKSTVFSIG